MSRLGAGTRALARQRGVGLVEVMIAVLVLSVGLLGLAGLQGVSLRNTMSSLQRTQATSLAYDVIDAIRADRQAVLDVDGNLVSCGAEIDQWEARAAALLPDGELDCTAAGNQITVTLSWTDNRGEQTVADRETTLTFTSRI